MNINNHYIFLSKSYRLPTKTMTADSTYKCVNILAL